MLGWPYTPQELLLGHSLTPFCIPIPVTDQVQLMLSCFVAALAQHLSSMTRDV